MSERPVLSVSDSRWNWIRHNSVIDLVLLVIRPRAVPATSATVAWIKRHPLIALVSLAYGLTWFGFIANPIMSSQRETYSLGNFVVVIFMVGGCLWAALIVETAAGGITGRIERLRRLRLFRWRVNIAWYAIALLLPAVLMIAGIALADVLTGTPTQIPLLAVPPSSWLSVILINIGAYTVGNFEEFAWRGVALPRFQATQPAVKAALIVGTIQAIWHLPYFFIPNSIEQQVGPFVFLLWNVALSIIITWIFNNAKGSLLIAILFHAANDSWVGLLMSPGNSLPVFLMVGVECVLALVLITLFGARRLSHKPEAELAQEIVTI
jgi:membrane protease YdiL (CAAX protease family)